MMDFDSTSLYTSAMRDGKSFFLKQKVDLLLNRI